MFRPEYQGPGGWLEEWDLGGRAVWQAPLPFAPQSWQRLADGRTLCAGRDCLAWIDAAGRTGLVRRVTSLAEDEVVHTLIRVTPAGAR